MEEPERERPAPEARAEGAQREEGPESSELDSAAQEAGARPPEEDEVRTPLAASLTLELELEECAGPLPQSGPVRNRLTGNPPRVPFLLLLPLSVVAPVNTKPGSAIPGVSTVLSGSPKPSCPWAWVWAWAEWKVGIGEELRGLLAPME